MPPTSLISTLLAVAICHAARDRQTSAFVNVPAGSGLQPKHRPCARPDTITTKSTSPCEILARGGWAVSPPKSTDNPTAAATGLALEAENEPQEEGDIRGAESGEYDEPFPIWSGMSAFEEGEAEAPPAGVIIVDPFCDYLGGKCQKILEEAGYAVVQVLSDHILSVVMRDKGAEIFRAPKAGEEVAWAAFLPFPPVAVLCESDAGLATAERLSAALLGPRFGGINEARRDKHLMNEAVRKAGLAAVRQVKSGDWSEARRFLSSLGNDSESSTREKSPNHDAGTPGTMEREPLKGEVLAGARLVALNGHTSPTCHHDHTLRGPETSWTEETGERDRHGCSTDIGCLDSVMCVVKPARGCASGGVFLCRGEGEAEEAFNKVLGSPKYATPGAVNSEVLVQEYLEGTEYVVDTVSRDGEHKVMAIWKYDKRPANGAPFVYFATKLMASDGEDEKMIMEYARDALDALGVKYGPTHTEVMMVDAATAGGDENGISTKRGTPFLVEVNTRWHLTDFAPITDACVGYNAVEETLSAYVDPERFDSLPRDPPTDAGSRYGRVVHLVSYVAGKLEAIRHEEEIRRMESFVGIDIYADPERGGTGQVKKTIDIRSDAGWVHLVHEDLDVLERDYRRVVELMPTMFRVSQAVEAKGDPGV